MVSKEKQKKIIIDQYIKAYNEFDIENMLKNVHPDVEFKNIANNEINVHIKGSKTLKKQAEDSTKLLKKREMKITEQVIDGDLVENKIEFKAVLAIDIPEGPKAGELVKLKGKSIFKFKNDKIISIEDIS
ncbi:MAG: nuclear transport factor 2 family protein [Methanobacterium sp.]|nr:nuclear transport factor 2 family protein [Methanobacterium sp.]